MRFINDNYDYVDAEVANKGLIYSDLIAKSIWYGMRPRKWKSSLLKDGSITTIIYRLMAWINERNIIILDIILAKIIAVMAGSVIGRKARFGPGLVIVHPTGIVINGAVRGGSNCIIQNGVTIGAERGKTPVIGDHVFIGTGAKIIGGIKIGNSARIGANAVVNFDVPENATVVGVPGKIVRVRQNLSQKKHDGFEVNV